MATLTIREGYAKLNGDKTVHEMKSGIIEIVVDAGRALFILSVKEDGALEVRTNEYIKVGDNVLSEALTIRPKAINVVEIARDVYEKKERTA